MKVNEYLSALFEIQLLYDDNGKSRPPNKAGLWLGHLPCRLTIVEVFPSDCLIQDSFVKQAETHNC